MRKRKRDKARQKLIYSAILGFLLWCILLLFETAMPVALPINGEPPEFYANQLQDDLRRVFVAGIKEAKHSILLIIYTLTDGAIIQELREKGKEGVDVQVICDANTCSHLKSKLGGSVKVHKRYNSGIMHQKILVVDRDKTWIGSANMTAESLRMHGNLVQAFHSKEIAAAVDKEAQQMLAATKEPHSPYYFLIKDQLVELWFLPGDRHAVKTLIKLIDTAKKTIRVAMFTWTRYDLAHAIIAAQRRGVDVQIVIDSQSGNGVSAGVVQILSNGGIPVRLSEGTALLHHKFLYIDGRILVNGSANWTKAAFTKNDDCFMILHNLTPRQHLVMEHLWKAISAASYRL